MECGLLFSGGKDSTLAALLLDGFYDLTLVTVHFGITEDWKHASTTAERLGFAFRPLELDREIGERAADRIFDDGTPRNGIQLVHRHALEAIATDGFHSIADGTRRDDRIPSISRAQAQRLEEQHAVDYLAPLSGFGRDAVDRLVQENLEVEVGPTDTIVRADYEAELRELVADRHGPTAVEDIFPDHEQTYVRGPR